MIIGINYQESADQSVQAARLQLAQVLEEGFRKRSAIFKMHHQSLGCKCPAKPGVQVRVQEMIAGSYLMSVMLYRLEEDQCPDLPGIVAGIADEFAQELPRLMRSANIASLKVAQCYVSLGELQQLAAR